jgi:1,2-diacylglycerol-3-alpha-glucose alpha-1,2-galactosyltransferase
MSPEISFYIITYGYLAIFILIFIQEIGIPNLIPNELVLIFSGYLVFAGSLNVIWVILVAISADFIGTNILYVVFYFFGRYLLNHKPSWLPVSDKAISALSLKLSGGNKMNLYLGRLTPFLRGYTSVIAGLLQIKPLVFLPITLISALTWSLFYVSLGILIAPYWYTFLSHTEIVKYVMFAILLIILSVIIIRFVLAKRKQNNSNTGKEDVSEVNKTVREDKMKIHVVSETPFVTKGDGVHTSFTNMINLLKEKNDVEVVVNSEGSGDVYHAHTYGPYYFWKGRKYKGKRIYTVHVIPDSCEGTLPKWKYWYPFVKWYFKQVYSYADVCIAISPRVKEAIREICSKTRVVSINNPIPIDRWKRTEEMRVKGRQMLGFSDADFVVLGVGQLQARKGVEDFIDIGEQIPEAKFVWAGGRPLGIFTEGIKRINNRIAKASEHIKFTGMLDPEQMPYVYAASDVFLFPSYQENCPMAPMEAAASGIPVVFRDIKEYKLLYENPYIKADSTGDFIQLTRKLMNDNSFYHNACSISEQLITQFDKDEIRKKLISLYSSLLYTSQQQYTFRNNPTIVSEH